MRCNGYVDCPYGEDEMECTPNGVPTKRPDNVWTLDESNFQQAMILTILATLATLAILVIMAILANLAIVATLATFGHFGYFCYLG